MKVKIFKSKIGFEILVPLILILVSLTAFIIAQEAWISLIVIGLAIAFIFSFYLNTSYQLTSDQNLLIQSGFFKYRIEVGSIKKIKYTRNPLSSPALSTDRLEISYKSYDTILISPKDKEDFIRCILELNPEIIVELSTANPS